MGRNRGKGRGGGGRGGWGGREGRKGGRAERSLNKHFVNSPIGRKALHKTMSCVILALNWINGILPIQKSLAIRKYWKRGSNSS